ncbi:serine hydrolase domain-containing protein [Ornithinicoccus halotolerans]|uniref:serine hydrolase domain-containing protein n=1 Tax=Ornithinicoccus halotolerans TaxID=1748220 RepID=UPI00188613B0|nr:serine hydrolase domain-containing protein [Ornithinicoccus halotolerans]
MTAPVSTEELGSRTAGLLGPRHRAVGAVAAGPGGVATAELGTPESGADFEIGSVTKGLTGLLYVDAVDRGEVAPGTPLGSLLELGDSDTAAVTLGQLATHTSGLPRLPAGMHAWRRTWDLIRRGTNPYREDVPELLRLASGTPVRRRRGRPRYSNLGFQLLGHAVAAASGRSYADLLRDRLLEPLGMTGTYLPERPTDLRPGAVAGTNRRGRPVAPWTGAGIGPAGGVRMPVGDLAILLGALLQGSAPGVGALDPVRRFQGRSLRIGAGWLTLTGRGGDVTWHNGGTGGFRSFVGLHRASGTGVALVTATARSVDRAGFRLLAEVSGSA